VEDPCITVDFFDHLLKFATFKLVRPHEFSACLAKLICTAEELFVKHQETTATIFRTEIKDTCEGNTLILVLEGTQEWTV